MGDRVGNLGGVPFFVHALYRARLKPSAPTPPSAMGCRASYSARKPWAHCGRHTMRVPHRRAQLHGPVDGSPPLVCQRRNRPSVETQPAHAAVAESRCPVGGVAYLASSLLTLCSSFGCSLHSTVRHNVPHMVHWGVQCLPTGSTVHSHVVIRAVCSYAAAAWWLLCPRRDRTLS